MADSAAKVCRIGSKSDKSEDFSDQIRRAKMYWIWSEKIPGFVPFGAIMTHFWLKSETHDTFSSS